MSEKRKPSSCPFCFIGEYEKVICSDETMIALLNVEAIAPGQTLVISKRHCTYIFELSDYELCGIFNTCSKISRILISDFGADGVNIINNNGKYAGQQIPHFHLHIVPRYKGDLEDPRMLLNKKLYEKLYNPSNDELEQALDKFRKYFS
jgi:diadenosine tetraphosphate (Ap4A) HIT family hydrolase